MGSGWISDNKNSARLPRRNQAVRLAAERPDATRPTSLLILASALFVAGAVALWQLWPQPNGGLPPVTAVSTQTADVSTSANAEEATVDNAAAESVSEASGGSGGTPSPGSVPFSEIARIMAQPALANQFPERLSLVNGAERSVVAVEYGFDSELQNQSDALLARYKPDYGVFFAMRPDTGQVLAMASFSKVAPQLGNLAIRASYPAASVFKIVTAAAAIESASLSAESVIPYNGKSTALYKKHVLRHTDTKWTRRPQLSHAFGKSVNPVFGRLGVFDIGGETLHDYAARFGFNRTMQSDLPFEDSRATVNVADEWEVAEMAAGYTRRNKMSPVHGAMIAGSVINEGIMMQPFLVTGLIDEQARALYRPQLTAVGQPMSGGTAEEMRKLMRETVKTGSARKVFRGFFKGELADAEVGGKTGSLTGSDPKGRNEWFVGYGKMGQKEIAFAALTVNIDKWTVKPAYLARKALESYLPADSQTDDQTESVSEYTSSSPTSG